MFFSYQILNNFSADSNLNIADFFFTPMEQFEVFKLSFLGFHSKYLEANLQDTVNFPLLQALNNTVRFQQPIYLNTILDNNYDFYPVFSPENILRNNLRLQEFSNLPIISTLHAENNGFQTLNYKLFYTKADKYDWSFFDLYYKSTYSMNSFFSRSCKTNYVYYTTIGFFLFGFLCFLSFGLFIGQINFIPSYFVFLLEQLFLFKLSIIRQQVGLKGQFFFNFSLTLFFFLLVYNLLGMFPYSFTITSHIIGNFLFSSSILLMLILIGLEKQGFSFFKMFFPSSAPLYLLPLMFFIEVVSYLSRAFSLAIRLFANLMAGHTLLNILCGFIIKLETIHFLAAFVPFLVVFFVGFLEIGIAFIQAYVFCVLVLVYLKDSLLSSTH